MQVVKCAICGETCDTAIFTSTSAIDSRNAPKGWVCMDCYYALSADYTD